MAKVDSTGDRIAKWMRGIAVVLALSWAGFWTFFGIASGIAERVSPVGVLYHSIFPGLIFLVSAIVAWRWGFIGGILLIVESLLVFVAYPIMFGQMPLLIMVFTLLTLALPPLIAGLLFLVSHRTSKKPKSSQTTGT
jgi:hypothetical protein